MLNYLLGICQTKKKVLVTSIAVVVSFLSCSAPLINHNVEFLQARPVWFDTKSIYSNTLEEKTAAAHPFFDLVPFSSQKDLMINFVVLTPEGETKRFDIDLYSGKLFSKYHLCKQKDVWNNYTKVIYKPNFTEGFIPRLLDGVGLPQKIIVFGAKDTYKRALSHAVGSHRVRVVGGVVEQFCEKYPCLSSNEWLARLVLVAVDPTYEKYTYVRDLYDLKKEVDWKYTVAYLANASGRTQEQGLEFPYIRVVDEITADKALLFAIEKGYLYQFKDMMKLRDTCHDMYDYIWKKVYEIKTIKAKLSDKKWIDSVIEKNLQKQKTDKKIETADLVTLRREMMEQKIFELSKDNFSTFFVQFYKNFKDKYAVCSKNVMAANVNEDSQRHWFFAYLEGFFHANDLNYIYNCSKREWFKNYRTTEGRWALDQYEELTYCSSQALDAAFDKLPVLFNRIMNNANEQFYRYVTYDFYAGSHEKLYSWVKVSSKRISCAKEPDSLWSRIQGMMIKEGNFISEDEKEFIFPSDVQWEEFNIAHKNYTF